MTRDTACQNDAGSHPFYVPFPGAALRFIKVIDVERNLRVRRGKEPEIFDVRIPAHLNFNLGVAVSPKIASHNFNRAAEENEWRFAHQLKLDRQKLGDAVFCA